MKKPRLALVVAFGFLLLLRIIAENLEELTMFVAMINMIALFVVLYDVAERIKCSIHGKIDACVQVQSIANREKKRFTAWLYFVLILASIVFAVVYLKFWCSGLGNDIISIVALAMSILDGEIVALATFVYKV